MNEFKIRTATGQALDAKVEVLSGQIIVHSRSGAGANARNPDYRPALETILERLATRDIKPDVYLHSRPAQKKPVSERLIAKGSRLTGPVSEQFKFLVRAMNAGTDSHGAWRRILLEVPGQSTEDLAKILSASSVSATVANNSPNLSAPSLERSAAEEQRRATTAHIGAAVAELLDGHEMPQFAHSRDYDLVTRNGERLAPKRHLAEPLS